MFGYWVSKLFRGHCTESMARADITHFTISFVNSVRFDWVSDHRIVCKVNTKIQKAFFFSLCMHIFQICIHTYMHTRTHTHYNKSFQSMNSSNSVTMYKSVKPVLHTNPTQFYLLWKCSFKVWFIKSSLLIGCDFFLLFLFSSI